MIDHNSAIQSILQELKAKGTETAYIGECLGRIIAEDIIASTDHPFFDQTAVDGYAFNFSDRERSLKVIDEVAAGSFSEIMINEDEAIRIFTGAPVTGGADTVVMQEYTEREERDGEIFVKINDDRLKQGGNIRRKGEQLKEGDVTLKKGSYMTPSCIGFLASIGIQEVPVYKNVTVGIIVSGNEFAENGSGLKPGQIYESNGVMLQSALQDIGIPSQYDICVDDQPALESMIEDKLKDNDLLIITGGVSVGDYDFTKPALENLGFKTVFHKVKQKPGKPILFVTRDDGKVVFGLPGNPRSAMMCYYIYILPGIYKMTGKNDPGLFTTPIPLGHDYSIKGDGKTYFVSASVINGELIIKRKQGSHMMLSMATSNVIAVFPSDKRDLRKGDAIDCHIISPFTR